MSNSAYRACWTILILLIFSPLAFTDDTDMVGLLSVLYICLAAVFFPPALLVLIRELLGQTHQHSTLEPPASKLPIGARLALEALASIVITIILVLVVAILTD
jgi:hypothetical protein